MCRVQGTCRGRWPIILAPPREKRVVLRFDSGRGGRGNFGGTGAAYYGRQKCVKVVQGVLCVAELTIVRIVPSRVIWPPAQ